MAAEPATRVNYFDRQYIRLSELRDEQAYHVQMRRRHNLSHHLWGIVLGLEIVEQDDGRPAVRPGLAVDGYGRELLLTAGRPVGRELFDRYGTSRLDVWLEYQLEFSDDRLAPIECDGGDPSRRYRAEERGVLVFTRGGARPDPRHPPGVPVEAFEEPLATPDDPKRRWPVYLGRIVMDLPASGTPTFEIDTSDRVYVGLNAEVIEHPGNVARLELGRRPTDVDRRTVGDQAFDYPAGPERDFAVFVPGEDGKPHAVIAVYPDGTQIRGTTRVHGNLVIDGASLEFRDGLKDRAGEADGNPAIYRKDSPDELRIDIGSLNAGERRFVLGVTKDGEFKAALTITFPGGVADGTASALVTVHGDLRIEGTIDCPDIRTRTVSEEVAALLTGMVQSGMTSGA